MGIKTVFCMCKKRTAMVKVERHYSKEKIEQLLLEAKNKCISECIECSVRLAESTLYRKKAETPTQAMERIAKGPDGEKEMLEEAEKEKEKENGNSGSEESQG